MDARPPLRSKPDTSSGFTPRLGLRAHHLDRSLEAARQDGALAALEIHSDWGARLRREAYLVNTHASTSLEGNSLTLAESRQVALAVDRGARTPSERDEREIAQHYQWFRALDARRTRAFPDVDEAEIVSTHRKLLTGVLHDAGALGRLRGPKRPINVVFGSNEGTPPARVSAELAALSAWATGPGLLLAAPIRIGVWLHEFLSIHPFSDGNGRVARALTHRLLISEGLPGSVMIALDAAFNQDRRRYFVALDDARSTGLLAPWLDYFLDCLLWAYHDAQNRLRSIATAGAGLTGAQAAIVEHVVRTGSDRLVVSELAKALPYRPDTITTALLALANEHGLLIHNGKRGRASAYRPSGRLEM